MTRTTILAAAAALLAAMPLGAQTASPQPAVPDTAVPPAPAPVTGANTKKNAASPQAMKAG